MLVRLSHVVALAACLMAPAAHAYAQTDNILAVGISSNGQIADSSKTDGDVTVGVQWRYRHDQQGWGWQYDALGSWFKTGVNQPIDGTKADLGALHVRPFLAGYGYTWVRGPLAITADLIAGLAINSFNLASDAGDRYQRVLGASGVTADAGNSLAAKPELNAWYDLNKRIGIRITGGFLLTRPTVHIRSSLGEDARKINADTIMISVGAVYKIF